MRIPSAFAFYAISLEGMISAKEVLNSPGHDVMDTWHTIGTRRAFVKNPSLVLRSLVDTLIKNVVIVPPFQHFLIDGWEVHSFIFRIQTHVGYQCF